MKFLVTYEVRDGEFEYTHFNTVKADSLEEAVETAKKIFGEWTENEKEYRIYRLRSTTEISEADLNILQMYGIAYGL